MDAYLDALRAYQSFNPAGWVALYRVMPMWAGLVSGLLGIILLLGGGGRMFRLVAGPIGAGIGFGWTPLLFGKLSIGGYDPRLANVVAAVLTALGLLYPPIIVYLGVGIPLGLLGGEIAGPADYIIGFAPAFILGGLIGVVLMRQVSAILASCIGGWLLVIGAMASLHRFTGLVGVMARQPWGIVIAAGLFALAGSIYQIAVRASPEEVEKRRAERKKLKERRAEQKALEKRWTTPGGE